ncbi:hypothetical protein GHT07_21215 [Caenimonas koreensis DSM 17982]|uniref:Uncharacterized protein n=1 Tax=Caenimonas koreensis DSM 17982 TaxID=1121255 RepID=A0A844BEE8_9BURK|nr:hypothetical protein [Caenimonas koreensis]MRD49797.1 hypothetical protein [Caenimonas koreensis DSM 17982]
MNLRTVFRTIWIVLVTTVLVVSMLGFDGKPNSDIAVFLVWLMIGLTAPAGLLVPLGHVALYEIYLLSVPTSYESLFFDWLAFCVLGYLQWFKLVPFVFERARQWRSRSSVN